MVLKFFSVLNSIKNCNYFVPNSSKITRNGLFNAAAFCTEVTVQASPLAFKRQKISKAMKAYLQRSKEHNDFIKTQQLEYQIGKRHLANMMGEDPETFTQKDIDNAIEYLFPSGLYDKRARPAMKSPEEVFPARKAAEFDETGRPFHSMFYTGRANFFKLLYDIVEEMKNLNDLEDRMIRNGLKPDESQKIDLTGFQWTPKEELEKLLVEKIADIEYTNFTNAMSRLVELPYSYKRKEFIGKFMKPLIDKSKQIEIPKTEIDENGRQFVTTYECLRKKARGDVTIRSPGTGQMQINGRDITYFEHLQSREQLIFPLIFADMLGKVDVEAHVEGGGPSGQAGALRWGIAMCLRSFVDAEMVEKMRLAGLLTRDYRRRERKKFGQEGARRKYTWKKR